MTQVSLSKEGETKMTEDKTKLNFSIGAVAGLVLPSLCPTRV